MSSKQRVQVHVNWNDICQQSIDSLDTAVPNDIDSFIHWIESFPNRSDVEVHLNTGRKSQPTRKFQRTLQTLGCAVVTRYCMPAMA